MTYSIKNNAVNWNDKRIAGADAASFVVSLPIVGCDIHRVYVLGKPAALDRASFQVLSICYVRDKTGIFLVMESKIKPMPGADAVSFEAIGAAHGRDANAAWFRDKKIRLGKGGSLDTFRELASAFATDGHSLYFRCKEEKLPNRLAIDWSAVRLKAFGDNEVICPWIAIDDGTQVVVRYEYWQQDSNWGDALPGAQLETLVPLQPAINSWNAGYMRDNAHLWYRDKLLSGVSPHESRLIGPSSLVVGQRLYCGSSLTMVNADNVSFVAVGDTSGALFHNGLEVLAFGPGESMMVVATRSEQIPDAEAALSAALARIFRILFTVFDHFLPIESSPYRVLNWLGLKPHVRLEPWEERPNVPLVDLPCFTVQLGQAGVCQLTRSDGSVITEHASGWYTLACRFWAAERGRDECFLPYPALGHMMPYGDELVSEVLNVCASEMMTLVCALYRAGHEDDARIVAYQLMVEADVCKVVDDPITLQNIADLPRELVSELHWRNFYYNFEASTNLAVARSIISQNLLSDPDWRMRLYMAGKIHSAMDNTSKETHFFDEVLPTVMARFDIEPVAAVRERLAMVVEMALVHGQVEAEVSKVFLYESLLPLIDFCLQRGINRRFNRVRLAEALWALDREDEGDAMAEQVLSEVGELAPVQAIYSSRPSYRCHRIWFLKAKTRIAWRNGSVQVKRARADALEAGYAALLARYGATEASEWKEMTFLKKDIAHYREHVCPT